ncbi:hypothetical protein PFISCL1PPCAC_15631, partial [Pristionchus fissidentatus]
RGERRARGEGATAMRLFSVEIFVLLTRIRSLLLNWRFSEMPCRRRPCRETIVANSSRSAPGVALRGFRIEFLLNMCITTYSS